MNDLPTRRSFNRAGAKSIEQQIDTALDHLEQQAKIRDENARKARQADRALLGTITREQLIDDETGKVLVRSVRDSTGWHRPLKVNASTVTVPGAWGGSYRIPIARLLEVKPSRRGDADQQEEKA